MYEVYEKIIEGHQKELNKDINESYKKAEEELIALADKSINESGKKEKQANKAIEALILALWVKNGKRVDISSEAIMMDSWLFYEHIAAYRLGKSKLILTNQEIAKIIRNISKQRKKVIKWEKIIKGNGKRLDRQLKYIIRKGVKANKTDRQIQAEIEKRMRLNRNKAKQIARTETNWYRSEAKLRVAKHQEGELTVIKTWIYTYRSKEPRVHHKKAGESGQTAIGVDGKFSINGLETVAPQHFGIASEDINCTCDYKMEYAEKTETSMKEFKQYKDAKKQ